MSSKILKEYWRTHNVPSIHDDIASMLEEYAANVRAGRYTLEDLTDQMMWLGRVVPLRTRADDCWGMVRKAKAILAEPDETPEVPRLV